MFQDMEPLLTEKLGSIWNDLDGDLETLITLELFSVTFSR